MYLMPSWFMELNTTQLDLDLATAIHPNGQAISNSGKQKLPYKLKKKNNLLTLTCAPKIGEQIEGIKCNISKKI